MSGSQAEPHGEFLETRTSLTGCSESHNTEYIKLAPGHLTYHTDKCSQFYSYKLRETQIFASSPCKPQL